MFVKNGLSQKSCFLNFLSHKEVISFFNIVIRKKMNLIFCNYLFFNLLLNATEDAVVFPIRVKIMKFKAHESVNQLLLQYYLVLQSSCIRFYDQTAILNQRLHK